MTEHCEAVFEDCITVFMMVRRNGRCPTKEFIGALQNRYKTRFQRYLERLRDVQPIKSPENFRHLHAGRRGEHVYELKADKYRLYLVSLHGCWYTTHGRDKPKNNRVNDEITKALEIFWEWNGWDNGTLSSE